MANKILNLDAALEYQQATINTLREMVTESHQLLRDILAEVNRDYAHGGPSRLDENTIKRIEEIVLEK